MFPENCNRCGLCCAMTVRLSDDDIARIRQLGHREADFVDTDVDGRAVLKHKGSFCVFFSLQDGLPHCDVYKRRPRRCDDFPFEKRCTFGAHPLFRLSDKYKHIRKTLEKQTGLKAPED